MEIIYQNINLISIILLGMVAGSFITMATYRLAIEDRSIKDLMLAPSSCPKCNTKLKIKNFVPIFSWLFQKGKCSFCKKEISIRYFAIELICTLSFILIYFALEQNMDLKLALTLLAFMAVFAMIITDLENYFISDINQIILFIIASLFHVFVGFDNQYTIYYYYFSAIFYLFFGILLAFLFKVFFKKDGIGVDDLKFFAVTGFIIGIEKFAIFMFLSGIIGIIFGVIWKKVKKDDTFPFAPALIISLVISTYAKLDFFLI